jgi:hypothetical protein
LGYREWGGQGGGGRGRTLQLQRCSLALLRCMQPAHQSNSAPPLTQTGPQHTPQPAIWPSTCGTASEPSWSLWQGHTQALHCRPHPTRLLPPSPGPPPRKSPVPVRILVGQVTLFQTLWPRKFPTFSPPRDTVRAPPFLKVCGGVRVWGDRAALTPHVVVVMHTACGLRPPPSPHAPCSCTCFSSHAQSRVSFVAWPGAWARTEWPPLGKFACVCVCVPRALAHTARGSWLTC